MARLIDADEAYKVLTDNYHHRTELQHKALKEALSEVPTVDAVEVVRCRDCRFFEDEDYYGNCYCEEWGNITNDNGYCHDAERRKKDEIG